MSDAPERIWAFNQSATNIPLWRHDDKRPRSVEYVRADLLEAERARADRLEEALRDIVTGDLWLEDMVDTARAALGDEVDT